MSFLQNRSFRPRLRWWRRFWQRAPRQLRFTREGKIMVALCLAVGGAAINTGNNLLLLSWGLLLSAILISGLLSEATLRPLELCVQRPGLARAGLPGELAIRLLNKAERIPVFGVRTRAVCRHSDQRVRCGEQYQLRLDPQQAVSLPLEFSPRVRGLHRVDRLVATTSYPFGFFEKSRRFPLSPPLAFWVAPRPVSVDELVRSIVADQGVSPSFRAGPGEDFFSLRPFRPGDDQRRIHWRRAARQGRWYVVENEQNVGRSLVLELHGASSDDPLSVGSETTELAIATLGSLAEALLARGMRVGVLAAGLTVSPDAGPGQARVILSALARLDVVRPWPPVPAWASESARVAVVVAGARKPSGVHWVVSVGDSGRTGHGPGDPAS